ncbi:hypothetical protein AX14_008378 [Amanita brunnescens Koide BX004]|nr:hypothetical protein AX14_008378 [Amanita brunnescens Koide BX004]
MTIVGPTEEHDEWDDDDNDDDIDAEAEEIARRLGAELWADIRKAKEAAASSPVDLVATQNGPSLVSSLQKDDALATVKDILRFVELDEVARSVLASTSIPGPGGETVLSALQRMATAGAITKEVALPLSTVLIELSKSETLFSSLRHSNVLSLQLDIGKRKRDESAENQQQADDRPCKRPYVPETDLQSRVEEAVKTIAQALGNPGARTLDPTVISTIRLQLHRVFLFAVTSSTGGGHDMHALQEISGLIQVIGVLSGIQIGQTPDSLNGQNSQSFGVNPAYPWLNQTPGTDIGTAVYPCLVADCRKTFSRLFSLRGHQRLHTVRRPFRCNVCPASFVRNHDLKRHVRLHDNKAWKCGGCSKVFSRRDAIKRHKNGSRARGSKAEVCVDAEVLEVELDGEEGEESVREERRAKLWSGITVNQSCGAASTPHQGEVEEGEIQSSLISNIQATVLSLHGLLQAHVGNALGTAVSPSSTLVDATGSQATLASVIARAQLQNLPHNLPSEAIEGASSKHAVSLQPLGESGTTQSNSTEQIQASNGSGVPTLPALSMYGLSDEQTRLLEEAIAKAASAAQAQAEAEAALEEQDENENYEQEDEDYDGSEVQAEADEPGMENK